MVTAAVLGLGSLLKIGDGASNYTTIAEVRSISGPQLQLGTIDVTSHDSVAAFREFISGLRDAGMVTFDVNWIPSGATQGFTTGLLKAGFGGTRGAKTQFQVVFSDGASTTWTFLGFVTKFAPSAPHDAALTAQLEIKLTGQPTLT